MTTYKGLGISIKYGDHSRKMKLRANQHALGVRVPQGDNLRPASLRKLPSYYRDYTFNEVSCLSRFPGHRSACVSVFANAGHPPTLWITVMRKHGIGSTNEHLTL
jgi:hypothetical protein